MLDDARRYVYKACAAGSPVKLQTWADMVHVWQIFDPDLPQAAEAWLEIGKFLRELGVKMGVNRSSITRCMKKLTGLGIVHELTGESAAFEYAGLKLPGD